MNKAQSQALTLDSPLTAQSPARWLLLPSWMGSLLFHALLAILIFIVSQAMGPRGDSEQAGDGSFRQVGIQMLPPGPAGGTGGSGQGTETTPGEPVPASAAPLNTEATQTPAPLNEAPVPLNLPKVPQTLGVIGPGAATGLTTVNMDNLVKPSSSGGGFGTAAIPGGTGTGGGTGGGDGSGGGGTTFLGVKGVGKRFVYVIDRSFSMANDNALQAAKLELLASIRRLNETQQFQIIFYNNKYVVLNTRGGRYDVFRGTDAQRLLVTEQIREITPDAGTRHLPAILEALSFKPDVIFLLTDGAAESALDMKDLEQIRRQNRGGTHIHCIEFGRAEKSMLGEAGNFLKVLAKENDGQYAYRNLKAGF